MKNIFVKRQQNGNHHGNGVGRDHRAEDQRAHVRQPCHGGVRLGPSRGGARQEDGRKSMVGAFRSKHVEVRHIWGLLFR